MANMLYISENEYELIYLMYLYFTFPFIENKHGPEAGIQ
jgi:hypothetical protein